MATPSPATFVIAVDAGGTHTRVGCFARDGSLLSLAIGAGGSPDHNHDAQRNVSATLARCLAEANLDPADAVGLGAGMAAVSRLGPDPGLGRGDAGNAWAEAYYALPGLSCPRTIVNDAAAAHRGAFLGGPGVIVVAGTGSMILAITADGHAVESGHFEHYAGGARHLSFETMHLMLAGATMPADAALVAEILTYWGAADLDQLRSILLGMSTTDRNEITRRYGSLAPTITSAADTSPLADQALRELCRKTALGVHVLAPLIGTTPAPVATAGALASDPRFMARLADALTGRSGTPTTLVVPALEPLRGAALLAYQVAGIGTTPAVIERLIGSRVAFPPLTPAPDSSRI